MSFLVAIIGLAVLILIHEAGHFVAARAVGMTPRKFYLGFGPPLVKKTHNGVEYAIATFPLGGYVKIPGMSRPEPGALAASLRRDVAQAHAAEIAHVDSALERDDEQGARVALEELRPALGDTRAWQELEMSLAPDAYWRQQTWRRLVAIGAGPAVNIVFAIVIFAAVFMVASDQTTNVVAQTQPNTPARAAGLRAHDHVVVVAGRPVKPADMAKQIRATAGKPFTLVVIRHGHRVTLGPLRARLVDGAYRIGIVIEARTGPGESPPQAVVDATKITWFSVRDTVVGMAHIFTGRDTNHVSSSVGIVRVSAAAWRDGLRSFLSVLAEISLALGVLNLIPVLPLDGGHITIALVEKLRGRTFAQGVYVRYSLFGLSIFAILMYLGLRNDLGFGG
ncbi:MAG TPA: M50 family metallopeptidase [Gaiellaceae bacterium]|nr:M50 family metallopeptidase [Gaiellaceae bacterium]